MEIEFDTLDRNSNGMRHLHDRGEEEDFIQNLIHMPNIPS